MENKITKAMVLEAIAKYFGEVNTEFVDGDVTAADVVNYANLTLAQFEARKAKEKERRAEKKVEDDPLIEAVFAAVGEELETIADIAARVEGEDVTVGKVTFRLNALAEAGRIEKGEIKYPGKDGKRGRTVKGYKLPEVAEEA